MAAYDNQGYLAPGFDLDYPYQIQSNPSPLYSASTVSDLTLVGEQRFSPPQNYQISDISPRPAKKQRVNGHSKPIPGGEKNITQMPATEAAVADAAEGSSAAANKPKRVRTGCLTCRERHLKCDEGLPNCQNCRKSSRQCKRGVRLNFIDTTVKSPPMIPPTADWQGSYIWRFPIPSAD